MITSLCPFYSLPVMTGLPQSVKLALKRVNGILFPQHISELLSSHSRSNSSGNHILWLRVIYLPNEHFEYGYPHSNVLLCAC